MTKIKWAFALLLSVTSVLWVSGGVQAQSAAGTQDPLVRQMVGTWAGKGTRVYAISGRQVDIDETVVTTFQILGGQPAVVSSNQVTETSSAGAPNTYTTTYWVKAQGGQPGIYELGSEGTAGAGAASATGVLGGDGIFRVEQNLGNGYSVHSETSFAPDETVYTEVFMSGKAVQSRTKVDFTRVTRGGSR